MTRVFKGFPPGKSHLVLLPADFFTDLLPLIDDLAEMQVTLFALYAIQQREGDFRYLRRPDFAENEGLMHALSAAAPDTDPDITLDTALVCACIRKTLLRAEITLENGTELLYFMNSERGRAAIEQIKRGEWTPGAEVVEILPERPNAYRLYEENIGPLTPIIADGLKDAERDYPPGWLEDAIRVAVEANARSWRFIQAVLDRWRREGRKDEIHERPDGKDEWRRFSGNPADYIIR